MEKSRLGGKNGWVRGDDGRGHLVCVSVSRSVYIRYPIRIMPLDVQTLTWTLIRLS